MKDDPCFRCPLPDCDERSPRCAVRRLANRWTSKVAHEKQADVAREAYNELFKMWLLDAEADASEGVRPWPRRSRRSAEGRKSDRASAGVGRAPAGAASGNERCAP